jgi:diguanylate cyclase (GGDEF)-like protein
MSQKVLIVEDSKPMASMLSARITSELPLEVCLASTYAEAVALLDEGAESFDMALIDLKLPDALNGEVLDLVLMYKIPTVVFTSTFSDEVRTLVLSKNVVDYVLKDHLHNLDYLVELIRRVLRNHDTKILVVDDSKSSRQMMKHLLTLQRYSVIEAQNGVQALAQLKEHPDVKLVVTDYVMPEMDGFELVSRIRRRYGKNKLAVIGISTHGSGALSARFLKKGANDFITKPFLAEEFYCRVNQNIDYLEYVARIEGLTFLDYLTTLWNRRYLFEEGKNLYLKLKRRQAHFCLAMIDLDHFKRVNDSFGHDVGDQVLKRTAGVLREHFSSDAIVARLGGEEFCVLFRHEEEQPTQRLEAFRDALAAQVFSGGSRRFSVTVSIGATSEPGESLEQMISAADKQLYLSKMTGRNKTSLSQRPFRPQEYFMQSCAQP